MRELRRLLPFEERFKAWMLGQGMRWDDEELAWGDGEASVAYRLRPAGETRRVVCALHGAGNDAL